MYSECRLCSICPEKYHVDFVNGRVSICPTSSSHLRSSTHLSPPDPQFPVRSVPYFVVLHGGLKRKLKETVELRLHNPLPFETSDFPPNTHSPLYRWFLVPFARIVCFCPSRKRKWGLALSRMVLVVRHFLHPFSSIKPPGIRHSRTHVRPSSFFDPHP